MEDLGAHRMGGGLQLVKGGLGLCGRQVGGGQVKGRQIGGLLRGLIIDFANDDLDAAQGQPPVRQMTALRILPQHVQGVPRLFRANQIFWLRHTSTERPPFPEH